MGRFLGRRPSPAMMVALLALFVALGGTGYAAVSLPKGSVGAPQLKKGAVTPPKVAKKTIALFRGQRGAQGPVGPQGAAGPAGAQGPAGPPGMSGHEVVTSATVNVPVGGGDYYDGRLVTAQCPAGKTAVGGGYEVNSINTDVSVVYSRATAAKTGWEAYVYNGSASAKTAKAYAICVAL